MKSFLIICSVLIGFGMFLPFIQDYSVFGIHELTKDYVDNSEIVLFLIMFIISSWLISIGYTKKVKFSILGIIGVLFYFYIYYNIIDFIFDYEDYASYLFKNESGLNYILALIGDFGKNIGIGFYIILLGFLGNSLGIFRITYNGYISLNNLGKNINNFFLLKTNPNLIIRDNGIRISEKTEETKKSIESEINLTTENTKEELKITDITKTKLTIFFILGNIGNLIISGFSIIFFIGTFGELSASFTPTQIKGFLLGIILTIIFLNLFLINRYINRIIEEKILFRYYLGIGIMFLIILYSIIQKI